MPVFSNFSRPSPRLRHGAGSPGFAVSGGSFQRLAKLGLIAVSNLPNLVRSHPTYRSPFGGIFMATGEENGYTPYRPGFWVYFGVAVVLVVLGGVFAGLTLGLMGQDEIYLQVIQQSGDHNEKKNATKVLRLLKRGKHWVLVTLLLSNVITNETLPIVLDRSLGGGWPAVLSSTILIVIFGEIIPQSVCVRYGLGVGAFLSPFVICLMYLMYPIAYPTALLLDYILGEDHGTVYKKAGLKTLVTLHKSLGSHPSDRLNEDEVTIISAVLDLKEKPVGAIMTPIKDVFTMSSDTILDVNTTNEILSAGYSRIPIHAPGEPTNFVGMLLVKVLITYDPEDEKRVGEFPLATLPETAEDTSCLDIVNFFQEGKSHMVLVSEYPGENNGALGVVTLEDVIEELIGEEIVDESDVFIDVHKAIRRLHPSPMAIGSAARRSISAQYSVHNTDTHALEQVAASHNTIILPDESIDLLVAERSDAANNTSSPNTKEVEVRRPSCSRAMGGFSDDIIAHLTLGPANLAGRPRETKSKTVKIKHTDSASRIPEDVAAAKLVNDSGAVDGSTASNGDMIKFDDPSHDDSLQEAPTTASANMNTNSKVSWGNENLLPSAQTAGGRRKKKARTGSLVERLDVVDGIPKTIIETTSSSEDDGGGGTESSDDHSSNNKTNNSGTGAPAAPADNNGVVASRGETTPLLRY